MENENKKIITRKNVNFFSQAKKNVRKITEKFKSSWKVILLDICDVILSVILGVIFYVICCCDAMCDIMEKFVKWYFKLFVSSLIFNLVCHMIPELENDLPTICECSYYVLEFAEMILGVIMNSNDNLPIGIIICIVFLDLFILRKMEISFNNSKRRLCRLFKF